MTEEETLGATAGARSLSVQDFEDMRRLALNLAAAVGTYSASRADIRMLARAYLAFFDEWPQTSHRNSGDTQDPQIVPAHQPDTSEQAKYTEADYRAYDEKLAVRAAEAVLTKTESGRAMTFEEQCSIARIYRSLARQLAVAKRENERLRGWPEIDVGKNSPAHSPVDRYRCENEDCPEEWSVWEFRPDDYDLDESAVLCPACKVEGEMFLRWFRGGQALNTGDVQTSPPKDSGESSTDGATTGVEGA